MEAVSLGKVLTDQYPSCTHPVTEVRYKRFVNGTKHLCTQCLTCGKRLGEWLGQDGLDMATVALFDEALAEAYRRAQARQNQARIQRERRERHEEYERYLSESENWYEIRQLVLKRDDYKCQACLLETAGDVHHKSYQHLYDEICFDLVSVCRPCHKKIHGKL